MVTLFAGVFAGARGTFVGAGDTCGGKGIEEFIAFAGDTDALSGQDILRLALQTCFVVETGGTVRGTIRARLDLLVIICLIAAGYALPVLIQS